jgi:hypothetical protein
MKLPYHENAYVPEAKIVKYLLNLEHKGGGKEKAAFFMRFGFTIEKWEVLAESLLLHARTHDVVSVTQKEDTTNYAIDGILMTPDNRRPIVRTVWTLEQGSQAPRFVTAYPR